MRRIDTPAVWSKILLLLCLMLTSTAMFAQPVNDECDGAIDITNLINDCSASGAFTNVNATSSTYGAPACFGGVHKDVWFTFTPIATDVTIVVRGNTSTAPAGTIDMPAIAMYEYTTCGGTINELQCEGDPGSSGIVEMYKGGLTPGVQYLIRIQGHTATTGTFQICINNYNPPAVPGSDCITASVLCDKSSFVVQSVTGTGNEEEGEGSCLTVVGPAETNSSWFTWTCDLSGTLTFTLTPTSTSDDLDFAVYELPNGVDDCSDAELLRCMASGSFTFPSPCMGPTGLSESSTDNTEPAGCNDPSQDNFVAAINMISGVSYGVLINNFTSTGNGYQVSFGGSGTFLGPEAAIDIAGSDDTVCINQPFSVEDISTFANGSIISSEWNFGAGASPVNANGVGPHNVSYPQSGNKQISLTVTTDRGCKITKTITIFVQPPLEIDTLISPPTCNGGQDGTLTITHDNGSSPFQYNWGSGFQPNNTISNLAVGLYTVTIRDNQTCTASFAIQVNELELDLTASGISSPSCFGYTDGSITVILSNGLPPYTFDWGSGPQTSNVLDNVPSGTYTATVTDANLCTGLAVFEVTDHPIVDVTVDTIGVTCYGANDGNATALPTGGVGNFTFEWDNGATTANVANLTPGIHTVTVTDGNGCPDEATFTLYEPPQLFIDVLSTVDLICYGDSNGQIVVEGSGGRAPYTFNVDGGPYQAATLFTDLFGGEHTLVVQDSAGCTDTTTAVLFQPEQIIIDAGPNVTINLGDSTRLEAVLLNPPGLPVSYEWGPQESLFTPFDIETWSKPVVTTTYLVVATDSTGCRAYDAVTVIINPYRPVFIPNAFTPNDDGNNDFFNAFTNPAALEVAEMRIYDRWGELVYQGTNIPTNDPSSGWDGRFRGKPLDTGVYVYYMVVRFIDGVEVMYEGDISILK